VDPGTDRIILRLLDKNPDHRYQSMDEVIDALARCYSYYRRPTPRRLAPRLTQELAKLFHKEQARCPPRVTLLRPELRKKPRITQPYRQTPSNPSI
jgi:hypothetical protein